MKLLSFITILLFTLPIYSWTPDTTKLFWNRDFIIEFGYGYSYVKMGNLNKYYLEGFGKEMGHFDENFHSCSFLTPEIGLIFTNNIISTSLQLSNKTIYGNKIDDGMGYPYQPNLYISFWTINLTYRRLFTIKTFLIGIGTMASIGKGSAYVGTQSNYEFAKQNKQLSEGTGGGGTLFGELDYILFKHLLLGFRTGASILFTETLKDNMGKWIVGEKEHEINLNYSGFSGSLRIGFLW
jgi:hypothetical protein